MASWESLLKVAEQGIGCGRKEIEPRVSLLRDEALTRLEKLRLQARQDGIDLLAIAAREGVGLAQECGLRLPGLRPRRRRRSSLGWLIAAAVVAAVAGALFAASRD